MAHICTHSPPELRSPLARAPAHVCTQAGPRIEPHQPTPKDWREIRSRGRPGHRTRQPPPQGDPASLGCGQWVSQAVAKKPQGHPVPAGRVHGPAVPHRRPPTRPSPPPPPPKAPPRQSTRARPRGRPEGLARALYRQPRAGAPPELQSATKPGASRSSGAAGAPQLVGWGPEAARSHTTLAQARRAPFPGRASRGALGQHRPPALRLPSPRVSHKLGPSFRAGRADRILPAGRQAAHCCRPGTRPHAPTPLRLWVLVRLGPARELAVSTEHGANHLAAVCAAAGRRLRSRAGRAGGGAGAGRPAQLGQSPAALQGACAPLGPG